MDPKDQRKNPRLAVIIPARVYPKGDPSKAVQVELLNMSTGGAFVKGLVQIKLGEEIVLKIDLFETCSIEGEVVDMAKAPGDLSNTKIEEKSIVRWARGSSRNGFGVEFVDLSPEKQEYLSKVLDHLKSIAKTSSKGKKK
jgi:c-di-GMP-binding flagellar brake protein YcgR